MNLKENKATVFSEVAQACKKVGRSPDSVNIIAVTKYVDSSIATKLVEAGVRHLGENRVDKFLEKYRELQGQPIVWHLIGSLQRRKVKDVINHVDYFHALDSVKLAREINKRADRPIKCFLQVNLSREASKHGFLLEELEEALPQLAQCTKIELVGLMTMAPLKASKEDILTIFQKTEDLRCKIKAQAWPNMPMTDLSMGMSQDCDLAVQAGSTFVRIGTAFFK